jgi:Ca-activated chloride channel family protein
MFRWQFALALSAAWMSLACTAAVAEQTMAVDPEPEEIAASPPTRPDDEAPAEVLVEAAPEAEALTPPDARCNPSLAAARAEPVDDPTDPGSGRLVTQRRDGTWVGLPLRHTSFDTSIVGTVAETTVTQRFENPLTSPVEAVYTFPLPHDGAVDDYWIRVQDRAVHGIIKRRAEAVAAYEKAKAKGRTAGLLEQERPNIFTQSLANLPAGESIEVTMHIVQPLRPDGGVYELALPTVVGPRYVPGAPATDPAATGTGMLSDTTTVRDASRISPPILPPTIDSCGDLSIEVSLEAGRALQGVESVGHRVAIAPTAAVTRVTLDETHARLNRDFILRWRHSGPQPVATLLADGAPDADGYFTLTVDPPAVTGPATHGQEFVFLVDASGSMSGAPMELSKETIRRFVRGLTPADAFSVIRFSEAASGLGETLLPGTKENRERALQYVDELSGGGGTEMTAGIRAAFAMPRDPDRTRFVVLLTDGYIGNETEIFDLVEREIGDTRLFGLGVGSSVNRYLLDGVAKMGRGSVAYVDLAEPTRPVVDRLFAKLRHPAMEKLHIDWGDVAVRDVGPTTLPDLFAGEPVVVFGRYSGELSGEVVVHGERDGKAVEVPVELRKSARHDVPGLASMWARARIGELAIDPSLARAPRSIRERAVEEIIELSLTHRVLTEHTAFVAVDTESRVHGHGKSQTLVQGVDLAAGMAHEFSWGHTADPADGDGDGQIGRGGGGGTGSGYGRGGGAGFGGRGVRVPQVRVAKATVQGAMDRTVIRRIVRAHLPEVRACYNRGLVLDSTLAGRITIQFAISPSGAVTVSTVAKDEVGDGKIGKCIAERVKHWRFPAVRSGGTSVVTYPFLLRPPQQEAQSDRDRSGSRSRR